MLVSRPMFILLKSPLVILMGFRTLCCLLCLLSSKEWPFSSDSRFLTYRVRFWPLTPHTVCSCNLLGLGNRAKWTRPNPCPPKENLRKKQLNIVEKWQTGNHNSYPNLLECQLQCYPWEGSPPSALTWVAGRGSCLVSLLPPWLLPGHSSHSSRGDFIKSPIGWRHFCE